MQDIWLPTLKSLDISKQNEWKKLLLGEATGISDVPLPLLVDSNKNIRIVMGLDSTVVALKQLVSRSISKWKADKDSCRKFYFVVSAFSCHSWLFLTHLSV